MTEELANTELRHRIAGLLRRYPVLKPAETGELIEFLKTGPAVDRGMLKGDDALGLAIQRVEADHADEFRIGAMRQLLVAAMIALPFIALCWLVMDKGA